MQIRKTLQFLVTAVFILGIFGFAPTNSGIAAARVQPQIAALVASDPNQMVRVIVQQAGPLSNVKAIVARLGGKVTADLSIINAFAVEMTAESVLELAKSDDVRWVSLDAPVESTTSIRPLTETVLPPNYYLDTLKVRSVWEMGLRGEGVTIAIIDSGISNDADFLSFNTGPEESLALDSVSAEVVTQPVAPDIQPLPEYQIEGIAVEGVAVEGYQVLTDSGQIFYVSPETRVLRQEVFCKNSPTTADIYGHGTLVAGVAAGNGNMSREFYSGIAPGADLISLKIADGTGMAYESDVVAAMQWVYENKDVYNIRVINISLNTTVYQSYHTSPMDAAAEILWFNGVVVVVSAGNKTVDNDFNPVLAPPANDPFVITVGATDEKGTAWVRDDVIASFSPYDATKEGFIKPEIHAPGKDIISILSKVSEWDVTYPERVVGEGEYFRASGTSLSAPMVAGAVALVLQDEPYLTPDQVKYRLVATAGKVGKAKYLNAYAAVIGTTTQNANTGITASQLLWSGSDPVTWTSVGWNSVGWNSVGWNSVGWNSVGWNSVGWNSTFWGE